MIYHEKDIDKLYHLPKTWSSNKEYGWNHKKQYRSWSALNNNINKVNPAHLIGKDLKYLTQRYLHRLPEAYRSIKWLMERIGIIWEQDEGRHWYRRSFEYSLIDNIVCINPAYKPYRHRRYKTRLPEAQRLKQYYENRAKERKFKRDKYKATQIYNQQLCDWEYYKRRHDAKQLEQQKLIQHGFDPVLSFRNH